MTKKLFVFVILLLVSIPAFAQSVDTAWVRRYDGPGSYHDEAYAIAVDESGNVYVTGLSSLLPWTQPYDDDYATIKYYADGDIAWVRRYDGGCGDDWACAVVVDDSGNVYVTGRSEGVSEDYATIKYYPNGDTAWVRRYNGPGNGDDIAHALVVDDSGNVYVTGQSEGVGEDYDYATIKYYSNGDTAWVRRYNGPGNKNDQAYALAVDDYGNVWVAGGSQDSMNYGGYVTIKYRPNGDSAWIRRYDRAEYSWDQAVALSQDGQGNAYVTGSSTGDGTGTDYATIKYLPDGDTAWVRRYDGSAIGSGDEACALVLDGSGNVCATGFSDGDWATVKYSSSGVQLWVNRYDGPANGHDVPEAMTVDSWGCVYVTGGSETAEHQMDYTTIKYSAEGDTIWVMISSQPYGGRASDIAIDDSGNVYVTGKSVGPGTFLDYLTIKYVQTESYVRDETGDREKPTEFTLSQNYPNPFNQSTKIEFTLAKSGFMSLNIYDVLGRKVKTLVSEHLYSGYKSVFWDGKDDDGKDVASGIYFCRAKVGAFTETKKLVLLK